VKERGLSPNAISLVERGEVAPTVETLCKIASALGVSASSLLQGICPTQVIHTRTQDYHADQLPDRALGALACGIASRTSAPAPKVDDLADKDQDAVADY
jgi:transcriptional regulator with XRE-family HTH domain